MTDWDRVLQTRARTGTFHGRSRDDETAYFEAFGGPDDPPPRPGLAINGALVWMREALRVRRTLKS